MSAPLIDNITHVERREAYLNGSPMYTPAEYNQNPYVQHEGNVHVPTRVPTSLFRCRPSRRPVVFYLQPTGINGKWGDWWAAAFLFNKRETLREDGTPKGRFTITDQRRNIDVPPTESYGDYVGSLDGVAPYGLE